VSLNETTSQLAHSAPASNATGLASDPHAERRKELRVVRNLATRAIVPTTTIGGMRTAVLDRVQTVNLMADAIAGRLPDLQYPLFMTSNNGQVVSDYAKSITVRRLFDQADVISADGQPMVTVSRYLSPTPLPERVATTDLFDDASLMLPEGTTYFMFGATADEIERAVAVVRKRYPRINLVGYSHGYLDKNGQEALFQQLDKLQPDVLWIGLGAPREQEFITRNFDRLKSVKVVKTSGGLFNFVSGKNKRAPQWMQNLGLEWLYRTFLEPRRLLMRYLVTNPHSLYLMLTRTTRS
jgi:N-acetylglucosaminyldiphosphoundecaprenol N-acetyl-beta-D-mannosaminyltransferase